VPVRHPQAAAGCARMQATPGIPWEEMKYIYIHWIGLRENLQETMVFTIK
jgi:hypothetical protein